MSAVALKQQAEQFAAAGQFDSALDALSRAMALDPGDADIPVQSSYVASLMGRYRDAREFALQASALKPRSLDVATEMISRLRAFNLEKELRAALRALPPPSRLDIRTLLQVGAQLSYFNLQDEAMKYLDEARRADPAFPPTLLARAQVLMYMGRFDEARKDLAVVEKRAPQIPKTYWLYSRMGKATSSLNHVATIRSLLRNDALRVDDRVSLAYALHTELDDLGDHAGAAEALDLALRTKRASLKYDASITSGIVDGLIRLDWDAMSNGSLVDGPTPIFIVGPHRSGTTLLEHLLDSSPDLLGIGEIYDFTSQMRYATDHHCRGPIDATLISRTGNVDFDAVGRGYMASVAWRLNGEKFFTDKLPTNFFNVGFILKALPNAKILHLVRDPMEVGFSNLRESFGDVNQHTYDQREMAAYLKDYQRLMAFWHEKFPGRILDVPYVELTRDPAAMMEKVTAYVGMEMTDAMRAGKGSNRAVATASAVQVREGVKAREVPKWMPYSEYLAPMRHALVESGLYQSS